MDAEKLISLLEAIRPVWEQFLLAVALIGGTLWAVLRFAYSTRLANKDSEIDALSKKLANKPDTDPQTSQAAFIDTVLRVQFYGDDRIPTESFATNVFSWYVYWSPTIRLNLADAEGKPMQNLQVPRAHVLFVTFAKPTSYRQAVVSFSEKGFPSYQVKQATDRHLVISIDGEVPAGSMELRLLRATF